MGRRFFGKLPSFRDPVFDLGTAGPLAQYCSQVLGRSLGQLGVRLDSRGVEAVLDRYPDALDRGQIIRRVPFRLLRVTPSAARATQCAFPRSA